MNTAIDLSNEENDDVQPVDMDLTCNVSPVSASSQQVMGFPCFFSSKSHSSDSVTELHSFYHVFSNADPGCLCLFRFPWQCHERLRRTETNSAPPRWGLVCGLILVVFVCSRSRQAVLSSRPWLFTSESGPSLRRSSLTVRIRYTYERSSATPIHNTTQSVSTSREDEYYSAAAFLFLSVWHLIYIMHLIRHHYKQL